ncbi:MAG: tryptophan 2,3-dioxygenase [Chitinophagaceae bacterium]|nr:tryptophan 2,3-dioxygenase [Chitinophagaceae bacterium]
MRIFESAAMSEPLYYHDYLQLDKILNAQSPESQRTQRPAHDEMLFIIVHQAYELWFKQLHYEVDSVLEIMSRPRLNDNSPELQTVVHRLQRCVVILRLLVQQIDVLETMTPMDFLDFRDLLRPASGFQSWQFKWLEAKLGLKVKHRHAGEYFLLPLKTEHAELIIGAERKPSLLNLVNRWLERMPLAPGWEKENPESFWMIYRNLYKESLADEESYHLDAFDKIFGEDCPERSLSAAACRSALFIMLYRGYPLLHLPFQLIHALLDIDEQLSNWRYRHMNMVARMIGTRIGTGGSSGKDYLKDAAEKHYIFREFAALSSFLLERSKLPALSADLEKKLGFESD